MPAKRAVLDELGGILGMGGSMVGKRRQFVEVKDEFKSTQYINIDSINWFSFGESTQINGVNHFRVRIETDSCYYNFIINEDSFLNMCEAMDIVPEGF